MGLLSIFDFFVTEFFDRELPAFSNLPNTFRASDVTLALGLFLLLIVGANALLIYRQAVPGKIVRELYSRNVFSPEDAVALSELSVKVTWYLRFSLHAPLAGVRRCVRMVGEPEPDDRKKSRQERREERRAAREARNKNPFRALLSYLFPSGLADARFYLDPARTEEAERRYPAAKNPKKTLLWTVIGGALLFLVLCRLTPDVLLLIDGLVD